VNACHRLPHFRGRLALARFAGQLLTSHDNSMVASRLANSYRIHLHLGTPEHDSLFYFRSFDDAHINLLRQHLDTPGAVFIDIGASVGIYTFSVADVVERHHGRIIAIEPFPNNIAYLLASTDLNNLQHLITLLPIAIGDRDGKVTLDLSSAAPVGNVVATPLPLGEADGSIAAIDVYKLDDHPDLLNTNRIDCIKIDIEGYDLLALRGMTRLIEKHKPIVFAEFNVNYMKALGLTSEDVHNWLRSVSYRAYKQRNDGTLSQADFSTVERSWDAVLISDASGL
jgi:FkbM family methyltransferase